MLCTGGSENVAFTNWRFAIWLLMRGVGLLKIVLSRLDTGHSHYDPDQRNSVFNRHVRGTHRGRGRREGVHSLGKIYIYMQYIYMHICTLTSIPTHNPGVYKKYAKSAHSDLLHFVEMGKIYDFKNWLLPMRNRLEEGISVCTMY